MNETITCCGSLSMLESSESFKKAQEELLKEEMKDAMNGVREYCEKYPVSLFQDEYNDKRWVIHASNEGGYNSTCVDLLDLIKWLKKHKPELLK